MDQRIDPSWPTFSRSPGKTWTRSGRGCGSPSPVCEALFRVREPNNRRALETRAERHRPAGALSCPSAALRLLEIGKARFMPVSQWRPHRLCWFR